MDIGSSFTYMFDDEAWIKKLAIGGGLTFLGIILMPLCLIGLFVLMPLSGYMVQLLKNVRDDHPQPLPEWENFGDLFMSGLMVFVISLVYSIPSILIQCVAAPMNMVIQSPESFSEEVIAIVGLLYLCTICLQIIISLLFSALVPAAIIRYAMDDSIGSAFQVGQVLSFVKNNIGDYVIVVLVGWVASILSMFGLILCGIGLFFTSFWATLVYGHLYGQLAQRLDGGDKAPIHNDFAPAV